MQKIRKNLNVKAGQKIVFIRKFKNIECPYICYKDPKLVKSYTDYAMIEQDLLSARGYFEMLLSLEEKNDTVVRSLFSSAITGYGRCFTSGEVKGVMIDPNQIFKEKDDDLEVHKEMMRLRHKFFAHMGGTEFETAMVYLALNPDGESGPVGIYRGMIRTSSFENSFYREAIAVINIILDWVKVKLDEAHERMNNLLAQLNVDNLYKQSTNPKDLGQDTIKIYIE